ncbi:hypothetical protein TCAL_13944 [Tigriopus californicus]|uniref:Uncharacterized protein n=1 Tax=Tigriopus californicus TaxID=6832 RepID=A0A553PSX2_TIGCA|nr:hypothetical protein TCAL_13944 [Tigriopus californicus]
MWVFAIRDPVSFPKATDLQRNELFQIARVQAQDEPVLYYLIDSNKQQVRGAFYKEQLIKANKPKDDTFLRRRRNHQKNQQQDSGEVSRVQIECLDPQ